MQVLELEIVVNARNALWEKLWILCAGSLRSKIRDNYIEYIRMTHMSLIFISGRTKCEKRHKNLFK